MRKDRVKKTGKTVGDEMIEEYLETGKKGLHNQEVTSREKTFRR